MMPCEVRHIHGTTEEVRKEIGSGLTADLFLIEARVGIDFNKVDLDGEKCVYDVHDDPYLEVNGEARLSVDTWNYGKFNWGTNQQKLQASGFGGSNYICLPIPPYLTHAELSRQQMPSHKSRMGKNPFFIGAPTALNEYTAPKGAEFFWKPSFQPLVVNQGNNQISYLQRAEWLMELKWEEADDPLVDGGLVFDYPEGHPYFIGLAAKMYGRAIQILSTDRMEYPKQLNELATHGICLCPSGHARVSFRTYDIMATGGILVMGDIRDYKLLYMPQYKVTMPDGKGISELVKAIKEDEEPFLKYSEANRAVLDNTPQQVLDKFMTQFR